jgi:hypothetical protein
MMKEISFTYEGAKYTLAFNRQTVQQLSQLGFRSNMITEQPEIGVPMLFRGAFMVHHRNMRNEQKDKIYESITNRRQLIEQLYIMYLEPINAMLEEPEEGDEAKNVTWEANF